MPTAVVTGANRGIGLEWVKQLQKDNWDVYAGYRSNPGKLKELCGEKAQILDVKSSDSIKQFIEKLPKKIDLLINNAGIADGRWQNLSQIDTNNALEVIDINALGPVRMTQALLPHLQGGNVTVIAMISSLMGSIDDCISGKSYAYRASKSALNMLTIAMKNELLEQKISVIILHPGWVQTKMGGPNATITVQESVSGMMKLIKEQNMEMSGRFVNYDGKSLPW